MLRSLSLIQRLLPSHSPKLFPTGIDNFSPRQFPSERHSKQHELSLKVKRKTLNSAQISRKCYQNENLTTSERQNNRILRVR